MFRVRGRSQRGEILVAVFLVAVLVYVLVPHVVAIGSRTRVTAVKLNCRIVQEAAERFAVLSGGRYPGSLDDSTPDGTILSDLLPTRSPLRNPFAPRLDVLVEGEAALPGQTGYRVVSCRESGQAYVITGCGPEAGTIVCTLTPRRDCRPVPAAVTLRIP